MKGKIASALLGSAALCSAALAQPAAEPAPAAAAPVFQPVESPAPAAASATLPAGSDVLLRVNHQLTTRTHRVGDNFPLTVVNDVMVDGRVVIPAGTRAVGQVTWRTGRGGFGKSGKMEIALRYVELDGRRIPLEGFHRQEGEGRTAGTIGAVVGAGVIGGLLVRGSNARIPEGFELTARTVDALPVSIGEARLATIAASYQPTPYSTATGRRRDARPTRNSCSREAIRQARGNQQLSAELERECRQSRTS